VIPSKHDENQCVSIDIDKSQAAAEGGKKI
jgi:hypothetical protein